MQERTAAQEQKDPIIIVSTGRCGSTLLSTMIREHPKILSLSEFFSSLGGPAAFSVGRMTGREFWTLLSTPRAEVTFLLQAGLPVPEILYEGSQDAMHSGLPPILLTTLPHLTDDPDILFEDIRTFVSSLREAHTGDHYMTLFRWLAERFNRAVCVERSGGSLTWLPHLMRFWPDARFIHLFRDGRDCAYSMSKHHGFRLLMAARRSGGPAGFSANTDIPIAEFGFYWSWMIVRRARLLRKLPTHRVLNVRYEDLVRDPEHQLARIAMFVSPDADSSSWIKRAVGLIHPSISSWRNLPPRDRRELERTCQPGLRALEYPS